MSYLLNSIDFDTYSIVAGHSDNSNIAIDGCFNLPERTGKCFHEWGDSDSIEPYAASGDIFFAGRDITFYGSVLGTLPVITNNLKTFYNAINAATGLSVFETPYNSASGYVNSVVPEVLNGGAKIEITFREPVVNLTGTLPASGINSYTIDKIPFSSFGLYLSKAEALHDLPELKEQFFTQYGAEGYQIVKRKNRTLDFHGFIIGSSLSDFQSKVSALYKLFSSSGTRNIKINDEINIDCFAVKGFEIEDVMLLDTTMIGVFKAELIVVNVNYLNALHTEIGVEIHTEESQLILI